MANHYFFLGILLPQLKIGETPEIDFQELKHLLDDNLTSRDLAKTEVVRRYYDISNIRSFWRGESLDRHGNFDENQLEDALVTGRGFPKYVYEFIDKHEHRNEQLEHFPELLARFFQEEIDQNSGFLRAYFSFEREIRLILTAFRARRLHRDLLAELQYENPGESFIAELIAQKDAKDFEPPEKYHELKKIFLEYQQNPIALHKALNEYRFAWVENYPSMGSFSIEYILSYLIRLIIVEKWLELNKQQGLEVIEKIAKETP